MSQQIFEIPSRSNPSQKPYQVALEPHPHCQCKGFSFNQTCRHLESAKALARRPSPMLAKPMPVNFDPSKGKYFAEEKFDGHRMLLRVDDGQLVAWSRLGNDCLQKMSKRMKEAARLLPNGLYDGELILRGEGHSYDVARLENREALTFIVFDALELLRVDSTTSPYVDRRKALELIFERLDLEGIHLAESVPIPTREELDIYVEGVWARYGEGVIVKKASARYEPGKRRDAFMKVKQAQSAVLRIVGWEAGTTGPQNVAVLQDEEGNETRVKIKNDELRARVAKEHQKLIGRELWIEYHERTADGSYRHPRWDHLEGE